MAMGGMQVRTLMFSAVMEGDVEDTMMEEATDPVPTPPTIQVAQAPSHPPTRPPARTSTRLASAATRRQTMAPSTASPPWPLAPAPSTQSVAAGVRPATATGFIRGNAAGQGGGQCAAALRCGGLPGKARFMADASGANHTGGAYLHPGRQPPAQCGKPQRPVRTSQGRVQGMERRVDENSRRDSLQRRKQMRQRSVDYARTTRTLLGTAAFTEGRAS